MDQYRQLTRMMATIRGSLGPGCTIVIDFAAGEIYWELSEQGIVAEISPRPLTGMESKLALVEDLRNCRIFNWHDHYVDLGASEGTHWSLEIEWGDQRKRITGLNAYPAEWKQFCGILRKWSGRAFGFRIFSGQIYRTVLYHYRRH
ncbi:MULTISPECIES: hypothetical protein [Paenibacillus]|uniref:Uncharacterized protein n=2 Tax=Paenibacillus campinasensis TaxID=66347 RepID=A0A268ETL6_9BACL|nr:MULTISPECIES: hypothetical protein [Paenibacillus]MUG67111.1 hypothetical protein [Paenibacillus campinasensis]PAD76462.1 hypothetical protein CHH67_12645 [Paenibacillus campinasensis]PAK55003.1 hypothetical protein CHH75_05625 [Paenibacillus sp. 7541]